MQNKPKINRSLINYIRISLIFGAISAITIFLISILEIDIPIIGGIIIFGILLLSVPGYLILPGLIYDDFKTGMVFSLDQMLYFAFMVLTLGIGPTLVYFIKFEPRIKQVLVQNDLLDNKF